MSTPLHDLTAPLFVRGLRNLSGLLDKGVAFAGDKGESPESLLAARLYPDMQGLAYQVQRASDSAKGCMGRLSGRAAPAMADDETTIAQLKARIAATIAYVESVPREAIDGRETAVVLLQTPSATLEFSGIRYVLDFALPNFFFHVTIGYALLRHQGVPIGKLDFVGPPAVA